MIISKTPLRISFAGGGTDLPSFYKENEYGAVLSTCVDSYIYVSIKEHTPLFDERIRLNYSESELVDDVAQIKNGIIRESLKFMEIDDRLYISTISDAPAMTGLGSSSAFCVGLLNALYEYKGMVVSPGRLAKEAAHIEIDILKHPIGKQDHYAAAFGGLNYFMFHADGSVTVKPVITSEDVIRELSESMISFWTRITRSAQSVLSEQNENAKKNSETLIAMRKQAADLVALLQSPGYSLEKFGREVHAGWEMKQKLAPKISNNQIESYYKIAIKNGAYGGKISGAGGGGFLNVFAPVSAHPRIIESLRSFGIAHYKFHFSERGTMVIRIK